MIYKSTVNPQISSSVRDQTWHFNCSKNSYFNLFGYVYLLYWHMWVSLLILSLSSSAKMEVEHSSQTLQLISQPITDCHKPEIHTTLMDNWESTVIKRLQILIFLTQQFNAHSKPLMLESLYLFYTPCLLCLHWICDLMAYITCVRWSLRSYT